jgi:hypothetical protein
MADDRRLSQEWNDLQVLGKVPEAGEGTTAVQAERDEHRKRPRRPTEDRRAPRKFTITCTTEELPDRLRALCRELGYANRKGEPVIASTIVEDLLEAAMALYEADSLEKWEEQMDGDDARTRLRLRGQRG